MIEAAAEQTHGSIVIGGVWLDKGVPTPAGYKRTTDTSQRLTTQQQQRVQGLSVVVDWEGDNKLKEDSVVIRLRMEGEVYQGPPGVCCVLCAVGRRCARVRCVMPLLSMPMYTCCLTWTLHRLVVRSHHSRRPSWLCAPSEHDRGR